LLTDRVDRSDFEIAGHQVQLADQRGAVAA